MIEWDKTEQHDALEDLENALKNKPKTCFEPDTLVFPESILKRYNLTLEQLEKKFGAKIYLF